MQDKSFLVQWIEEQDPFENVLHKLDEGQNLGTPFENGLHTVVQGPSLTGLKPELFFLRTRVVRSICSFSAHRSWDDKWKNNSLSKRPHASDHLHYEKDRSLL